MSAKILLATHNKGKVLEFRRMFDQVTLSVCSLSDLGISDSIPEDGDTLKANALAKALGYARRAGLPTISDDSGLEVDALGGAPSVRSARFAGEHASDAENNAKLLGMLGSRQDRKARFRCVLCFVDPGRSAEDPVAYAEGVCEGRILLEPGGSGGFGYDPIFQPDGKERSMAALPAAEKNQISHRAAAFRVMKETLQGYFVLQNLS
ncbi:MAG: RdgB/HAM1 family non-canonical purine NTP pyrophosphatase [Myxococcota bacterium]